LWCDMTKKTTAAATEAQISIQYEWVFILLSFEMFWNSH
jgi:hypothetical protein